MLGREGGVSPGHVTVVYSMYIVCFLLFVFTEFIPDGFVLWEGNFNIVVGRVVFANFGVCNLYLGLFIL